MKSLQKSRYIILGVLLLAATFAFKGNIDGRKSKTLTLFDNVDFTGVTTLTSNWFRVGQYQFFTHYLKIQTDLANFDLAIDDSLLATVKYELFSEKNTVPTGTVQYFDFDEGAAADIMALTISDTTSKIAGGDLRLYKSMHVLSRSVSPGEWMRVTITKATGHVLGVRDFRLTLSLYLQP